MARIEDLIDEIGVADLREQIARQVKLLKSTKRFGLVFEDHVPETVSLYGLDVRPGLVVQNRRIPDDTTRYRVLSVEDEKATIAPVGLDEPMETVASEDLLVVKAFEEPIFPGLTPVGEVRRGPDDKPTHTVISGENFHALQLLAYTHANSVDVIYIDPPYNTGARDWKYNNRFVDNNDAWRHSKWLAMMEKRLRLSRKLLKPDGVLIVTIDENEVYHLGLLVEELFPNARLQMITSVISPGGVSRATEFTRVHEYVLFLMFGDAVPSKTNSDLLFTPHRSGKKSRSPIWRGLLRGGSGPLRSDRPNMFYPVLVNPTEGRIVGAGMPLAIEEDRESYQPPPGLLAVWPLKTGGVEGRWELGHESFEERRKQGYLRASDGRNGKWTIYFLRNTEIKRLSTGELRSLGMNDKGYLDLEYSEEAVRTLHAKTVWNEPAHDAGTHGSSFLNAFVGRRAFPFPKSIYAVADTLRFFLLDRPAASVVDFFAGSGTTLHAISLLNAQDGGNRQCTLVTNNDVSESEAKRLNKAGHFAGDPEFEAEGIFESVTRPRVTAAITGVKPDGEPVEGKYLDQYLPGHTYGDGFDENVAFFRMDYLEPDLVELGRQYNAVVPLLWMAAGSVGSWEEWNGKQPWSTPADSTYGVLFDLAAASAFASLVEGRPEITNVWVVTDSHTAFVEVREELPADVEVGQLYREYLRNFTVNSPGVLD